MMKKYLFYLPVHVIMALILIVPIYMGSGAPGPFEPVQSWFQIVVFFFPIANIGNFITLFRSRGEENNLKYFLSTLPIMLLPYLILLLFMLRM